MDEQLMSSFSMNRRMARPPLPETITGTQATVGVGAKTLRITVPYSGITGGVGGIYKLKGLQIIAGTGQIIGNTQILDSNNTLIGTLLTAKTVAGTSVQWTKERALRARSQTLTIVREGNATGGPFDILSNWEFPTGITIRRVYATLATAPGGADIATFSLITGGVTTVLVAVAAANTFAENELLNINIPANQDVDFILNDTAALGNGYTLSVVFDVNEEQLDYPTEEYITVSAARDANATGGPFDMVSNLELPSNFIIRRAYATMRTAPGLGKTATFTVNGAVVAIITGAATTGEDEGLNIPVLADNDLDIAVNDDAAVGNGYMLNMILQSADPANQQSEAMDVKDRYGDVYVLGGDIIVVNYTETIASQTITARFFGEKYMTKAV